MSTRALPAWLHEGAPAYDPDQDREGIVQFIGEPFDPSRKDTAYLRPAGGGTEWTAKVARLRPARSAGIPRRRRA